MKRFTVEFKDVGRNKQTWTQEFEQCSHPAFMRAIKTRRALMSNDVDFLFRGNPPLDGVIIVGGFRQVGTFHITENQ